jgi:CRISPR-associated protein Cmr1
MRHVNPGLDPQKALTDWNQAATHADPLTRYSCELVTPLYGGGVIAGVVDEAMPIRPSGIRGQLRSWWRLACGPFDSPAAMFQRESAIWGGIAGNGPTASRVAVRVDQVRGLKIEAAFVYQNDPNQPGKFKTMPREADWVEPYAVFPARGELSKDKREVTVLPHKLALAGVEFRLGVRLHPELTEVQRAEVLTALRWWASFGGVGARTRRGLGAVQVKALDPVSAEEVAANGGCLVLRPCEVAVTAWKTSIGRLRNFRQQPGLGRNPAANPPIPAGRSRWPEADLIRRQTGRNAPQHAPAHPVTTAWPRAAFGLPIVFHFKDENQGEPSQQLLVPEGLDRQASALILRPYWDGAAWHPAALLLPGWERRLDTPVGIGNGPTRRAWPSGTSERAHLASQIKPMAGRGTDPLTAFLAYFVEKD